MIDDRRTGPEEALRIIDAMTATNERLRAELKDFDDAHAVTAVEWKATRSRLATATALIQEVWDNGDIPRKLGLRIKAFLAGQPAAPSWCEKCNSVKPCPGCTVPAAPNEPHYQQAMREREHCEHCAKPRSSCDCEDPSVVGYQERQPAAPYGTPDESPGFNAAWPLGTPKPAAPECPHCGDPLDADHPDGQCVPCHELPDEPVAPARADPPPRAHRRGCICVRCEAERAVLDAMAEADEDYLEMSAEHHSGWKEKLALAELARRGLK